MIEQSYSPGLLNDKKNWRRKSISSGWGRACPLTNCYFGLQHHLVHTICEERINIPWCFPQIFSDSNNVAGREKNFLSLLSSRSLLSFLLPLSSSQPSLRYTTVPRRGLEYLVCNFLSHLFPLPLYSPKIFIQANAPFLNDDNKPTWGWCIREYVKIVDDVVAFFEEGCGNGTRKHALDFRRFGAQLSSG